MTAPLPSEFPKASQRDHFRDELNFAEFPLAALSATLPKDQKTLEFTDEIFDKSRNQRITRKLTITASDKFGLPTAIDDEVILGLIQLTARSQFAERRVLFTRYELLKLLNWSDHAANYKRLEQSLKRWLGVTLYYENSWWSREDESWVSEGFHILDHVQILDQQRQRKRAKKGEEGGKSSFVWNEVVFNSFKAGYLKQLDFEFYKTLDSAIAKRLYRFLDKRFYHRQRLEFELRTFACEHIGLSKKYHSGELKRVLLPAIEELEERGFLKKLSKDQRFFSSSRGEWSIIFVRASAERIALAENQPPLVGELTSRGISQNSARKIVAQHDEDKIREKLSVFDWLRDRNDTRIRKSPAGFLYRSITEDFALPLDYQQSSKKPQPSMRNVVPLQRHIEKPAQTTVDSDRKAIDNYWNSLPAEDQARIERELVKGAPKFLRDQYLDGQKGRGLLFRTIRQAMIDGYVRKELCSLQSSPAVSANAS